MTDLEFKRLQANFNEGIMLGVQAATGKMIEILQQKSGITPQALSQTTAEFKLAAQNMLQRRGLVPSRYDVLKGNDEDVPLDFSIRL